MAAYQAGEARGFEQLFAALAGPLLGFLRATLRDAARAEDLLQETFLQLHRARHTYLPGRPVEPWVYAIARNVVAMSRRAERARPQNETAGDPAELEELAAALETDPVPPLDLRRALAGLPAGPRDALLLHHVAGLGFREVAAVLGISETAAKVRAHRALERLRAELGAPRAERTR
jgi:RNA polymerase sigma-70 factor (ECF subfamily)